VIGSRFSVVKKGVALLLLFSSLLGPAGCYQTPDSDKRVVILVGLDGFRWDYLEKFQPPNLTRLAREGVRAERMIPAFPSLTFPNFYTLATGLRPERHGIIANTFFDPEFNATFSLGSPSVQEGRWWGGEPVWLTAEKQGLLAACLFWPGSEAEIGGMRPSEWRKFDGKFTPDERVRAVLDWLALPPDKRPSLITLYFHEADTAAHRFGVESKETAEAVSRVDRAVGGLVDGIRKLDGARDINLVIVSDHGMAEISPDRVIALNELVDLQTVQIDFSGAVGGLRPLVGTADDLFGKLAARQDHFRVYRRGEVPARFHFRDNRRIPPVIMVLDEGWFLVRQRGLEGQGGKAFLRATHGFDPELPSMGALFIAWGPAFRQAVTLPPFENIHVYNLVCAVLGLRPAVNDGDRRLVEPVMREN